MITISNVKAPQSPKHVHVTALDAVLAENKKMVPALKSIFILLLNNNKIHSCFSHSEFLPYVSKYIF